MNNYHCLQTEWCTRKCRREKGCSSSLTSLVTQPNAMHKKSSFTLRISSFCIQWKVLQCPYLELIKKRFWIRSFFWSVFSRIRTEYGEIIRISPYSVRLQESSDQKKLRYTSRACEWVWYNKYVTVVLGPFLGFFTCKNCFENDKW